MKSRKAFSELIPSIIGGVIVTALLMALFTGFSGPFLNFMSDSEGIKNFNKFTSSLSTACDSGVNTQTDLAVSGTGKESFVFSLVGPETYKQITTNPFPFKTSSDSIAALKKCEDKYCYCLLKIKNACIADNQNAVVKDITYFGQVNNSYSMLSIYSEYKKSFFYSGENKPTPAQGFTVSDEGILTNVWIHGHMNDASSVAEDTRIEVKIVSSDGSGNPDMEKILASAPISTEQLKNGRWINMDFSYKQITFDRDAKYFIVIVSDDDLTSNSFVWEGSSINNAPGPQNIGDAMTFSQEKGWVAGKTDTTGTAMQLFDYAVTIKSLTSDIALQAWDEELAESFSAENLLNARNLDSGYSPQILALQCRTIDSDMGCKSNDPYSSYIVPRLQSGSSSYILMWMQPSSKFESFTAERPINSTGIYDNYLSIHSTPDLIPNDNVNVHYGGTAPTLAECKED